MRDDQSSSSLNYRLALGSEPAAAATAQRNPPSRSMPTAALAGFQYSRADAEICRLRERAQLLCRIFYNYFLGKIMLGWKISTVVKIDIEPHALLRAHFPGLSIET